MNDLVIKVCGMKHPDNILEVETLSPNMMGFIFYEKSPRNFDKKEIQTIKKDIKKIGVFVNATKEEIENKIAIYKLDGIQLHGTETSSFCRYFHKKTLLLKAFAINENFDFSVLKEYKNVVDFFLFDTKIKNQSGGTGEKFDWNLLNHYKLDIPFILSGGIGPNDANEISQLSHEKLYGIDLNSKFEIAPGLKDKDKIKQFISDLKKS